MLANSFIKALAIEDFKIYQFLLRLNHWYMSSGIGTIDIIIKVCQCLNN